MHEPPRRVLLVTTKADLCADLIIGSLEKRSAPFVRWNLEEFPLKSTASWDAWGASNLQIGGEQFSSSTILSAWYRRMVPSELPEALGPAGMASFVRGEISNYLEGVFETSCYRWVNRPSRVRIAENKLIQLALARSVGFAIPKTVVTNDLLVARGFLDDVSRGVVKAISTACISNAQGSWNIFTSPVASCNLLPSEVQLSPCIFQERLRRKADIRVTVVGSKMFGAEITARDFPDEEVDWRALDSSLLRYQAHSLPPSLQQRMRDFMKQLGLLYACFDFILTIEGDYVFLEVNPSGQWAWIEHETKMEITAAIVDQLTRDRNDDF
jgi:glutathione synthase/RimK-type ligase-like ATP-grasp enzyme